MRADGKPLTPEQEKKLDTQARSADGWTWSNGVSKIAAAGTAYAQDGLEVGAVGSGSTGGRITTGVRTAGKWGGAVNSFKKALDRQNDPEATTGQKAQAWAGFTASTAAAISWTSKATLKDPGLAAAFQKNVVGGAPSVKGDVPVDSLRRQSGPVEQIEMSNLDPDRRASGTLLGTPLPDDSSPALPRSALSGSNPGVLQTGGRPLNPDVEPSGVNTPQRPTSYRPLDPGQQPSGNIPGTQVGESPGLPKIRPPQSSTPDAHSISPSSSSDSSNSRNALRQDTYASDFAHDQYGAYKDGRNKAWTPRYQNATSNLDRLGRFGDLAGGGLDIYQGAQKVGDPKLSTLDRVNGGVQLAGGLFDAGEAAAGLAGSYGVAGASELATGLGAAGAGVAVAGAAVGLTAALKSASKNVTRDALGAEVAYDNHNATLGSEYQQKRVDRVDDYLQSLPPAGQPRTVVLNNNVADNFNKIGGPYKTSSGQFDPADAGKTPRKDWLAKSGDVVINGARSSHLDYDADQPNLPTDGQLKLPDLLIDDKKGKYSQTVDYGDRFQNQGYEPRGGPQVQRSYSERNWGLDTDDGTLKRRFPSDDPRAGVSTLDAGKPYWEKTVNPKGDWNLQVIDDQPIQQKQKEFPHISPPKDPGYKATDPSYEAQQARKSFKDEQDQWVNAFPVNPQGVPVIRNPTPFERNISTSADRRTVVQVGGVDNYTNLNFRHKDDRILLSQTPQAGVTVVLPPTGSGSADRPTVDVSGIRYLGGPVLTTQGRGDGYTTYRFWNGQQLEVRGGKLQLEDVDKSIQQQIAASSRGPR